MDFDPGPLPFSVFVSEEITLYASAPNGMISGTAVRIIVPENSVIITLNGEPFFMEGETLSENGLYEFYAIGATHDGSRPVYSVVVAIGPVNFLEAFIAPGGFIIIEMSLNYEQVIITNNKVMPMSDGLYVITIERDINLPEDEMRPRFFTYLTIDRTPPSLLFEGVDENGDARGEVRFIADEPVNIRIVRNGSHYAYNLSTLSEPGHYYVIATDDAGNESVYELRILYTMNSASWWIIALFAALLSGLVVYLIRNRAKVRIR